MATAKTGKRTLVEPTPGDKRFVRRDGQGQFKESDDVGRSLAADVKKKAKTVAPSGQGDRGDHAAKKTSAKKTNARKTGARTTAAKKTGAKKTGAKKASAKKTAAKKTSARKTPAKKAASKKAASNKTPARKSAAGARSR